MKYAFSHGKIVLLAGLIVICLLTCGIFNVVSQLCSARFGIELLLVDTTVLPGGQRELKKDIKTFSGVKYIGASSISISDIEDYVKTVENYTVSDYLDYLTYSKNSEVIFVKESALDHVYKMKNIVPLGIEGTFDEKCYSEGVLYAFPIKDQFVFEYEESSIKLEEDSFAILIDGDHTEVLRQYLTKLHTEEA